ncbi:MAG: Rrf2 family transcriptional regulator, partial [Clostridiales bacterium]|nr:Rrf2 family transcriptional regulator [Clostridiales bacterium]
KKSRYGLTALVDLSIHSKNERVALNSIAERNNISPQYLEQVFGSLRRAGILKSMKGSQGGYLLNDSPEKITVSEVIEALEGTYHIADEDTPPDSGSRGISDAIQTVIIDPVNGQLDDLLKNITLADLQKVYLERDSYSEDMYYI